MQMPVSLRLFLCDGVSLRKRAFDGYAITQKCCTFVQHLHLHCIAAEEEGFEPPVRCRTTVFKTAAIDHSAIPPGIGLQK